jgi:ABC-type sugar transport system ATPase subunit
MTNPPALAVRNAQKRFGAVNALKDVSLEAFRGEVLALLGDNGAGKSTLVKCISGVHALDGGTMALDGVATVLHSPAAARRAGIETVYQDLALFDNLTPAQNFYCGREIAFPEWLPRGMRFLRKRVMDREAAAVIDRLKVRLPKFDAPVALMSGGQRQAIAVARTVTSDADIILLDEPLAAMGAKEGAMILDLVARLRAEGRVSIIMFAHNYVHVLESCDRVNLIQDGSIAYDRPTAETSVDELNEIVVEEYRRARMAMSGGAGGPAA